MTVDANRIDLVLKYILATAGQEDPGNQEVGPIHLIKYAYLGDLAYAGSNKGQIFTGCDWRFYHFGPWCGELYQRIDPVVSDVQAQIKNYSSVKNEYEATRYKLVDDSLYEQLDRLLPFELTRAIRAAIHDFGSDTYSLLDFVYKTPPMLKAAPGEVLSFEPATQERHLEDTPDRAVTMVQEKKPLTEKEKKKRKEKLEALKAKIRGRLADKLANRGMAAPDPAPRYDEVFIEGQNWLDQIAGTHIEESAGELIISESVWKSRARSEKDIS